ncbi:WecB/TagA/CpsF family glycosyltransferase [Nicoliella spurrieriana]|uniref:N-acetylglucosaminyldiphosphoundecaprenol N-acetyl-beta-D-mannosaminyltransferase n=1 Tax=Nicoliella spurrieriana TaxID=2925830 RepID=A0A976RSL0_9LACO|nr:WecB/TagA/CpsF family glycosyltransferase [Nicoliella spurrieriana]UQS87038.1 WecB/TagA/CpsF family glycosyltransferase [Nicoliella spurrieriana]
MNDKLKRTTILNISYINTNFTHFLKIIQARINNRENTFIATVNPEIAYYAHQNPKYQSIINDADFVTPDGIGIIKAAQIIHQPIQSRITGFDVFKAILAWGSQNHKSAYFAGAKPNVIADLKAVLKDEYPGIKISGIRDGYFQDNQVVADEINATHPDMVFLALGSPKQEEFIHQYRHINNGLWIGLGGSFDVLSGNTQRAPQFWINHHLEWLYRLLKEPSRLPRIMVIPKYLKLVRKSK